MTSILSNEDIERLALGLIDRSLLKSEWTHAAHFAAALWLLRRRGLAAFAEMPALIRAYNEATGTVNNDSSGYHETITLASLRAAAAWLAQRPADPLSTLFNELMASAFARSDWLLKYWSKELLFSTTARKKWVEPDLQALPFEVGVLADLKPGMQDDCKEILPPSK